MYDSLGADLKHKTLDSYIDASQQIKKLHSGYDYFGEILADRPVRRDTWASFLEYKLQSTVAQGYKNLSEDVPVAFRIAAQMKNRLTLFSDVTEAKLVHGDYYIPNVLEENGKVTAVLDFNDLTLAGDYRMDLASAVIYLDQVEPDTSECGRKAYTIKLVLTYGESIREIIDFYELYYALVFASFTKQTDSSAYQWSVAALKRYGERYKL